MSETVCPKCGSKDIDRGDVMHLGMYMPDKRKSLYGQIDTCGSCDHEWLDKWLEQFTWTDGRLDGDVKITEVDDNGIEVSE